MDNRQIIQNSIDYVEENLKAEITANDLADLSGFCVFYFYRLFQSTVGMPVMQYILHRKLLNAIFEMGRGKKKIDIALEYGFSSYASFYKAFKREIGYTPSEFLNKFKAEKPSKFIVKDGDIMISHKKLSAVVIENWDIADNTIKDTYYGNCARRNENAFYVGENYILKVSHYFAQIKKQIELLTAMKASGLYTAEIVPTNKGCYFVEKNDLYFCLTKRLEGEHINPQKFNEPVGKSIACNLGKSIAKLHMVLNTVEAAVDEVNLYENVINQSLPKAKSFIDIPDYIIKSYSEVFKTIYNSLPKQIIHRDINPGNVIIKENEIGFIDFELSERNLRIYDLCYAATAILSETVNNKETFDNWIDIYRNIILGYDKVLKLTEEEKQALPYVVLSNQLVCIAYFSNYSKFKNILNSNIHMTKMILDNFEKLNF